MIEIEHPASPCTKICRLDRISGYCLGCWRTAAEIAAWPGLDPDAKRALLRQLTLRAKGQAGSA